AADSQLETKAGTIKGKVGYMAPEILRGSVDARADVYAVGVIIWEATAGRRLWKTKNEMEILTNLMRGEIPKLEEAKPEAPPELVRICAKAMAPDPEGRYPTAEALRVDLEAYLAQAGTVPTTRAIGTQMAAAFRAERDELRRVIEAQRSEIRQGIASRPQLPNVEPRPGEGHTPSHSSPRPLPNAGPLSISNPSVSTTGLNSERDAIAAPRNRKWLAGGSVAVVAAGVLAFTFWRSSPSAGSKEPTLVATPVEAQAAPAMPPAPPAPLNETTPSFAVVVRVAPGNATITMNGLRSSNPLATRCKRGETLHFVITANGFAPTTRDVACDTDLTLDLGLERVNGPMQAVLPLPRNVPTATVAPSTAVAMTATPPPAARPPVAATDANPDGGAHPRHAIDPNSPYGTP
ncbi:MAG TPA: protein kinase, partial [Polyangiaceae bacterium]